MVQYHKMYINLWTKIILVHKTSHKCIFYCRIITLNIRTLHPSGLKMVNYYVIKCKYFFKIFILWKQDVYLIRTNLKIAYFRNNLLYKWNYCPSGQSGLYTYQVITPTRGFAPQNTGRRLGLDLFVIKTNFVYTK